MKIESSKQIATNKIDFILFLSIYVFDNSMFKVNKLDS
uniref:Uncharacterized protein n=1 Tax=Rhizophora mucronata TaxID=61149 RepID=A0A2P2NS28_RHIMU